MPIAVVLLLGMAAAAFVFRMGKVEVEVPRRLPGNRPRRRAERAATSRPASRHDRRQDHGRASGVFDEGTRVAEGQLLATLTT